MSRVIHIEAAALGSLAWTEYLARFVLGGFVCVLTGVIARRFGASIGGLFLAFPAILPASATLIAKRERLRKAHAGLSGRERGRRAAALEARGAALGSVGLGAFALLIARLLPTCNAAGVLLAGLALWLALAVALWWLQRQRHEAAMGARA